MKILAMDTSNQPMSVGLLEDEKVITELTVNVRRNHSVQLMPAIQEVFKQAEWDFSEIDRIAVAEGPGSYTGLRIAVTIAKSLAWTHNIDLVGVSSLKVIAANSGSGEADLIVPLFDARRENIYTGLYARNEAGELIQKAADVHIAAKEWAEYLKENFSDHAIQLIGMDSPKFFKTFQEVLGEQVYLAPSSNHLPRASKLAYLAKNEKPTPYHRFVPVYLKLAEAEENWLEENPDFKGGNWVEKV